MIEDAKGNAGAVHQGRLEADASQQEPVGATCPKGPAPAELRMKWLLEALGAQRKRYEGMRDEQLAIGAQPLTKGNQYDRPAIREAKARAAAGILGQVINGLDWLLAKKRPWNKTVKSEPTNNEQTPRDSGGIR